MALRTVKYSPPIETVDVMKLFDVIERLDQFVGYLEEEDVEFDLIIDALREYISIVEDINGTAGL
jgi:hypothetical protein